MNIYIYVYILFGKQNISKFKVQLKLIIYIYIE